MKKTSKIVDIVIISVVCSCLIASVVAYFVKPIETKEFFNSVINFINQPLPIAGVSIALIGYVAFKFFAKTSFGKKEIQKLWDLNRAQKQELDVQKENFEKVIENLKTELDAVNNKYIATKEYIDKVASTIPNKKVNELVDQYGKKEEE